MTVGRMPDPLYTSGPQRGTPDPWALRRIVAVITQQFNKIERRMDAQLAPQKLSAAQFRFINGVNYTLNLADAGLIIVSGEAGTITIPLQADVRFPLGTQISIINTSGSTDVEGVTGVLVNGTDAGSVNLNPAYTRGWLVNLGPDDWVVSAAA